MILGTQYYRPPFPPRELWREDIAGMAAAGLDTVQLWACWGWIEPEPGRYRFEDYDELIELASRSGTACCDQHDRRDPAVLDPP